MVQLIDSDIKTREVLNWRGVHVLHFSGSSCSQKLRIFLNLKDIPWESHPIDLAANENFRPWFLGINPRGLVPVLVHDGAVHIESNDIIQYLEQTFPAPKLIPAGHETEVAALLRHEDDLHLDLRTLSFRFVFAPPGPPKSADALASYAANGSGTVQGVADREKATQIAFWERDAQEGITDDAARASAQKFRKEFDKLERQLATRPYLMGETLSVLDIAWFIYAFRLSLAGYPFARLHPQIAAPGRRSCGRSRSLPAKSPARAGRRHRCARRWSRWRGSSAAPCRVRRPMTAEDQVSCLHKKGSLGRQG
jgi:glutathione S-transferase